MLNGFLIFLALVGWVGWGFSIGRCRLKESSLTALRVCLRAATELNDRLFTQIDERRKAEKSLKTQNLALAYRVAQQSQLLARAAEAKADSERRLGYLFPRGLETPPSSEDALSPTWCRGGRFKVGERVFVKEGAAWVPATITGFEDGVYELEVDGCQFSAGATEDAIKPIEGQLYHMYEERFGKKARDKSGQIETCPALSRFKFGDAVKCERGGKWSDGVIFEVADDGYWIRAGGFQSFYHDNAVRAAETEAVAPTE